VQHPDLSSVLTHFCDRARPQTYVPTEITSMSASQRLESILWSSQLLAFVTYSGGDPAVCLTEATVSGLNFLIGQRSYRPWGLVFDRQSVYDTGGGPVWYARPDEVRAVQQVSSRVQSWLVRLEPGSSDWLEEREWRIPVPPTTPAVPLQQLRLVAVLVGDQNWRPIRQAWVPDPATGQLVIAPAVPGILKSVPAWWWDPTARELRQVSPFA
jgi:hypothetical protein